MRNHDKYEIGGLENCEDLDCATGEIAFYKCTGGFAGYNDPVRAKCGCSKK